MENHAIEEIQNIRSSLINDWFYTLKSGNINKDILLLELDSNINLHTKIKRTYENENLKLDDFALLFLNIADINRIKNMDEFLKQNIIFCINADTNVFKLLHHKQLQGRSFLYVTAQYNDFYQHIERYILPQNTSSSAQDINNKRYLYYIEKIDPLDFIHKRTKEDISGFLSHMILSRKINLITPKPLNVNLSYSDMLSSGILENTTYKPDYFIDSIKGDIAMLKQDDILTSRLAVILYRVAFLDITVSPTKIGRYFHERIGSKSKTFNPKHPRIKAFYSELIYKKSFKAYDLRVNEVELSIRREIAKNLLRLNIEELDMQTIALTVKLNPEEVSKLIKQL